eukprot:m.25793 g.25793  ORF g.25793 m.25793 type:complete len:899 (-) comp15174_c1_seq1:93-2789(-)
MSDVMERDPYLRASLATYLDESLINLTESLVPNFHPEQHDMMNMNGESFFGLPTPDLSSSKSDCLPPLSPPDSSHGSMWDGSSGSDDDMSVVTNYHVADITRSTPPPTTPPPVVETLLTQQSMLRFPEWDQNTTSIKKDMDGVKPTYNAPSSVSNPVRATVSPIGHSPLIKESSTSPAKKSSVKVPQTTHTTGRSGGPAGARKKVVDAAESQRKRTLHNAIERRYRNNINDKIGELKLCLPARMTLDDKMNKSTIIQKGIDYIRELEAALNAQQAVTGVNATPTPQSSPPNTVSDGGNRMLMCVLGCGLMLYLTPSTAIVRSGVAHHGGSRILTSVDDDQSALEMEMMPIFPSTEALFVTTLWYALRVFVFLVCVFLVFKRDMVTDPCDARENAKKCSIALSSRNTIKAKHHGKKALELLGVSLPTTYWRLLFGNILLSCRQILHRFYFGQWIDAFLVSRSESSVNSMVVVATMNHALHQMQLLSSDHCQWELMSQSYLVLRALNAAEAVEHQLGPATMLRIYISSAVQMELMFQSDLASIASNYYLRQARRIYYENPEVAQQLAWIFKPNGDKFFREGSWCTNVVNGTYGERFHPGSFEQLTSAFHLDLLEQGLRELAKGVDSNRVHDLFVDLRDSATVCKDVGKQWWGIMGLVQIAWRRGRKTEAAQYLSELEQLDMNEMMTRTQHFVQAASQGHQALLEGDHDVCWAALQQASQQWDDPSITQVEDELEYTNLARLLGFHQLLSTRIALIRLRSYLHQDATSTVPIITVSDGTVVSKALMLSAIQQDTNHLRVLSEKLPLAQSAIFKYQAIHRSLAGGRAALTERIFYKSLKTAQEHSLPFEEASVLLHSAVYLRSTMSVGTFRDSLSKAVTIFEKLQAVEELCTSRKLLQLANF